MRTWWTPWVLPVAMLVAVLAAVGAQHAGPIGSALIWLALVVLVGGLLVRLRLRYLKQNPPDPELSHRAFWETLLPPGRWGGRGDG